VRVPRKVDLDRLRHIATSGVPQDQVPELGEADKRISEQLVRLVQIFFGVVAGQSLLLYRNVITSPFHHGTIAAALALGSIYVMIVWSWIDWNRTMELRPYDFRPKRLVGRLIEQSERFRLYSDLAIVTVYAYVLFQVAPLVGDPKADIRYLLLGYPIVFVLYLVSGLLRIVRHGSRASNPASILWFLAIFLVILLGYVGLRRTALSGFTLNCIALVATVVAMRAYRWYRQRRSERATAHAG
jgi:hypothetical protein